MNDAQSLARGPLADGLHLAARSHREPDALPDLRDLIKRLGPLVDGLDAGPFYGAPAIAMVLHTAASGFGHALEQLDMIVERITRQRLQAAWRRIATWQEASFAEYDLLRGLAGLGAFWLTRNTCPDTLAAVLDYLVTLTQPTDAGPGWRVWHRPDNPQEPDPHVNNALAHGIAGPLAVLSLALVQGHQVLGHEVAIHRILDHLDAVRHERDGRVWWDRWDGEARRCPPQPSWCYGLPGLVRAQQLAAIALADRARQRNVEQVLLACLHDDAQLRLLTEAGICHGLAGLYQVTIRVADDAHDPGPLRTWVSALRSRLTTEGASHQEATGLLTGRSGLHLAVDTAPSSRWDACLALI